MELQEWDTLAIDMLGRSTNAVMEASTLGIQVEVVGNMLFILHEHMWHLSFPDPKPVIGHIQSGLVRFFDVSILASPMDKRNGVFFACWFKEGNILRGMAGLSCSVFDEGGSFTGILPEHVEELKYALVWWAESGMIDTAFAKLNFDNAMRFNQDDRRMAREKQIGTQATKPGLAEPPLSLNMANAQRIAEEFHRGR